MITLVDLWQHAYLISNLVNNVRQSHQTKYLTIAVCAPSSYLTYAKKKTIIFLCCFLSLFSWACLCLNSFSAPDAFLDILSQEIIRFFTPSGYQSRASIWCGTVGRDLIIQRQCRKESDSPVYLHITAQYTFVSLPSAWLNWVMCCISCQNSSLVKGGCRDVDCKTQVQNWGGTCLTSVLTTLRNLKPSKYREGAQKDICSFWTAVPKVKSNANTKSNTLNLELTWSASHIHVFLKVSLRTQNNKYCIRCAHSADI